VVRRADVLVSDDGVGTRERVKVVVAPIDDERVALEHGGGRPRLRRQDQQQQRRERRRF
jgi:hypothetical protein